MTMKSLIIALIGVTFCVVSNNAEALIVIDMVEGPHTAGDFQVFGIFQPASAGKVQKLLEVDSGNPISNSNTIPVGTLHTLLSGVGITNTNVLGIGFNLNQQGGSPDITVNVLEISFWNSTHTTQIGSTYTLGSETVLFQNYDRGAAYGEGLFNVQLGFEFMAYASGSPTDILEIAATHLTANDGKDFYYLAQVGEIEEPNGNGPTNPIPEPTAVALFGLGSLGLFHLRKRSKK